MFYFCPYLAYKNDYLGEREDVMTKRTDIGTDTHMIFGEFWKYFDIDYLYKEVDINHAIDLDNNPVTYYFYGICMSLTPEYDRDVSVLQRIFWKFSKLHAGRFLSLHALFKGNKLKVYEYFTPVIIEQHYYNELLEIYGTLDCVFKTISQSLKETLFISDIKTGNIPASIKRGPRNVGDETSVEVPPKLMFEIHFYALLYLQEIGYYFTDDRVAKFVLEDLRWDDEKGTWEEFGLGKTKEEEQGIQKRKKTYLKNIDHKLKIYNYANEKEETLKHGDVSLGYLYFTGDPEVREPVVVKKKFTYASFKTALLKINLARSIYEHRNEDEYYLVRNMKTRPEYNQYKCINCSRNKKCLKEIEEEFEKGL